jgi:hypothetical protein
MKICEPSRTAFNRDDFPAPVANVKCKFSFSVWLQEITLPPQTAIRVLGEPCPSRLKK